MNKFYVFPSIKDDGTLQNYHGSILPLACTNNMSFVLFFPIPEHAAKLIDYILKENPKNYNINMDTIGVYKTMLDSWRVGGRFLSGIILDSSYDKESNEDIILAQLMVSDESGIMDSIVKVNFVTAVTLAALERQEVLVSSELLEKLMPSQDEDEEGDKDIADEIDKTKSKYPVDNDILEMAKKIMSGKIQGQETKESKESKEQNKPEIDPPNKDLDKNSSKNKKQKN